MTTDRATDPFARARGGLARSLRTPPGLLLALLVLLSAGTAVWYALLDGHGTGVVRVAPADDQAQAQADEPNLEAGALRAEETDQEDRSARIEVRAAGLRDFIFVMDDAPVAGAEVFVLPLDDEIRALAGTAAGLPPEVVATARRYVTNQEGSTEILVDFDEAIIAGRGPGTAPSAEVFVIGDEELGLLTLPECVLTGKVTFADGRPAAGAVVTGRKHFVLERLMRNRTLDGRRLVGFFFPSETVVRADGSYELKGLAQGFNLVEVSYPGYARATAGDIQVPWWPERDFVLHEGAILKGEVVDRESGRPIPRVFVETVVPSLDITSTEQAVFTDADGLFVFDRARAGLAWIDLRATIEGYATAVLRLETLAPGEERFVRVEMEPGGSLVGEVTDAAGRPADTSDIIFYDSETGQELGRVETRPDGSFECHTLPKDVPIRVVVRAPSLLDMVALDVVLPSPPLKISLSAHGKVAGAVTFENQPVAEGRVRLLVLADTGARAETLWEDIDAATGTFLFEDVPGGRHTMDAFVPGYAPARLHPVHVDPPRTDEATFDVVLEKGRSIEGRITDSEGHALAGVRVSFADRSVTGSYWGALPVEATSDGDGRYRIGPVPDSGEVGLLFEHQDHARLLRTVFLAQDSVADIRFDVVLPLGATIRTWIEGANGRPLPNSIAELYGIGRVTRTHPTASSGICLVDHVEPGQVEVVIVNRGSLRSPRGMAFARTIEIGPGETRDVSFSWNVGGRLSGSISGPGFVGTRRQLRVEAGLVGSGGRESREAQILGDHYELVGLDPGRHVVKLLSLDNLERIAAEEEVEIIEGQESVLDFELGAARVEGLVTDQKGSPLSGARVALRLVGPAGQGAAHSGDSDEKGSYAVAGLARGAYEYTASLKGFGREDGLVEIAEDDARATLDVSLDREAVVRVAVTSRSGATLPEAAVSLERVDSKLTDPSLRAAGVDPEGRRLFHEVRRGLHRIEVLAAGHFRGESVLPVLAATTHDVAVELRRLGDLEIRVEDGTGRPAGGVPVRAVDLEWSRDVAEWAAAGLVGCQPAALVADDDGRIRLTGIPEGRYSLEVPGTSRVVEVSPGAAARAVLTVIE